MTAELIPELDTDEALGRWIWAHLVPSNGPADSVQGELLRANEKLRDEAQRNGNINWDDDFERLVDFLEMTLCKSKRLFRDPGKSMRQDLERLRLFDDPCTDDDVFDRIEHAIFVFCRRHRQLIPYAPDHRSQR